MPAEGDPTSQRGREQSCSSVQSELVCPYIELTTPLVSRVHQPLPAGAQQQRGDLPVPAHGCQYQWTPAQFTVTVVV